MADQTQDIIATPPPPCPELAHSAPVLAIPGQTPVLPGAAATENTCETLYIQNLNENIKPEGTFEIFTAFWLCLRYGLDEDQDVGSGVNIGNGRCGLCVSGGYRNREMSGSCVCTRRNWELYESLQLSKQVYAVYSRPMAKFLTS